MLVECNLFSLDFLLIIIILLLCVWFNYIVGFGSWFVSNVWFVSMVCLLLLICKFILKLLKGVMDILFCWVVFSVLIVFGVVYVGVIIMFKIWYLGLF